MSAVLESPNTVLRLCGFILHGICMLHYRQLEDLFRLFRSANDSPREAKVNKSRKQSRKSLIRRDTTSVLYTEAIFGAAITPVLLPAIADNMPESPLHIPRFQHTAEVPLEQSPQDMFVADHDAEIFSTPDPPNRPQFDVYTISNRRRARSERAITNSVSNAASSLRVKLLDERVSYVSSLTRFSTSQTACNSHFLVSESYNILGNLPFSYPMPAIDHSIPVFYEFNSAIDQETDIDILRDDNSVPEDAFGGFSRRISVATSHATYNSPGHSRVESFDDESIESMLSKELDSNQFFPNHMSRTLVCRRFLNILNVSRTHNMRVSGGRKFGTLFSVRFDPVYI